MISAGVGGSRGRRADSLDSLVDEDGRDVLELGTDPEGVRQTSRTNARHASLERVENGQTTEDISTTKRPGTKIYNGSRNLTYCQFRMTFDMISSPIRLSLAYARGLKLFCLHTLFRLGHYRLVSFVHGKTVAV